MTRNQTWKGIISAMVLAAFATPAWAQTPTPAVELFAGYSLLPANGDDFPRQTSHGLQIGVTANLNSWFGVAAEVGSQWNTARDLGFGFQGQVAKTTVREYLVGPRFTARTPGVNVFGQGWFGSSTGDAGDDFSGFSDSGLTFGGGAGVDVDIAPRVAVRMQYDWLGSFADIVEANSRFAAGLVWRLGRW